MLKVAVIMSVYRNDDLDMLKDSIKSILEQSFQHITLFIYRDGVVSPAVDSYLSLLQRLNNVRLFKSDINNGLAYALNLLIDEVLYDDSYSFIARMDSDDISRKERIERQVCFLSKHREISVCGTSCKEFGASFSIEEKHLPMDHDSLLDFSIIRCPFIHPSVMFRTAVFKSGIRYPTDSVLTEDMALWFLLLSSGFKFANINEILLDYRLNEKTINRRQGFSKALTEIKIRMKYMFLLKRFSLKNVFFIMARLVFHMLPAYFMKIAYFKAR